MDATESSALPELLDPEFEPGLSATSCRRGERVRLTGRGDGAPSFFRWGDSEALAEMAPAMPSCACLCCAASACAACSSPAAEEEGVGTAMLESPSPLQVSTVRARATRGDGATTPLFLPTATQTHQKDIVRYMQTQTKTGGYRYKHKHRDTVLYRIDTDTNLSGDAALVCPS